MARAPLYVYRATGQGSDFRDGWVGPIDSEVQAEREAQAWRAEGWAAQVYEADAGIVSQVNEWQAAADRALGRPVRERDAF